MSLFARTGDSTGQWGLAGDSIPVYSKVQGRSVYVRGDQAQAYVRNDAVQYSKANRKPGKTPPSKWPPLPDNLAGKKPSWNPEGYWDGKNGGYSWDDRSHGAGADRGAGAQDGHWDPEDPNDNRRWDRGGNLLPSTPQMDGWAVAGTIVTVAVLIFTSIYGVPILI